MAMSWWIDPALQRDYAAFHAAAEKEFRRMSTEKMALVVDAMARMTAMQVLERAR